MNTDDAEPYIFGWKSHPDIESLKAIHSDIPPLGMIEAELIDRAWGESSNLLLFFGMGDFSKSGPVEYNCHFMLSVWWNDKYQPKQQGPSFRDAPLGHLYMLAIKQTKNDTFTLDYAKQLTSDAPPQEDCSLLGRLVKLLLRR